MVGEQMLHQELVQHVEEVVIQVEEVRQVIQVHLEQQEQVLLTQVVVEVEQLPPMLVVTVVLV